MEATVTVKMTPREHRIVREAMSYHLTHLRSTRAATTSPRERTDLAQQITEAEAILDRL